MRLFSTSSTCRTTSPSVCFTEKRTTGHGPLQLRSSVRTLVTLLYFVVCRQGLEQDLLRRSSWATIQATRVTKSHWYGGSEDVTLGKASLISNAFKNETVVNSSVKKMTQKLKIREFALSSFVGNERNGRSRHCKHLALQASTASPPAGARGNPARRRGAEEHATSAGAKEVMFVQYARVDGVLRGGAPPPVRRDARGQCEQQRLAKPAVRTASVESQPPVLRPLEFTKLWSCRRTYRASKLSQITKTFKIATVNM